MALTHRKYDLAFIAVSALSASQLSVEMGTADNRYLGGDCGSTKSRGRVTCHCSFT
jgi:hypothetical protein